MTSRKKDNMSQLTCFVTVTDKDASWHIVNDTSTEWQLLEFPPAHEQPGKYHYTYEDGKWVFVKREEI